MIPFITYWFCILKYFVNKQRGARTTVTSQVPRKKTSAPLLDLESEPQKMLHSPLPPPCLKPRSWYPCHWAKLSLSFPSLLAWTKTPQPHPSYLVLYLIFYMLKFHCPFSHRLHRSWQRSSPTRLPALFSQKNTVIWFVYIREEEKQNAKASAKQRLNQMSSIFLCLNCFALKQTLWSTCCRGTDHLLIQPKPHSAPGSAETHGSPLQHAYLPRANHCSVTAREAENLRWFLTGGSQTYY